VNAQHPSEIQWIEGDLPDVHEVPKDCRILAWFVCWYPKREEWDHAARAWADSPKWEDVHEKTRRIEMVFPYENDLNPLRWCDSGCHPIGYQEKVKYWAWISHPHPVLIGKNLGGLS
jgi:hypothetical protein